MIKIRILYLFKENVIFIFDINQHFSTGLFPRGVEHPPLAKLLLKKILYKNDIYSEIIFGLVKTYHLKLRKNKFTFK